MKTKLNKENIKPIVVSILVVVLFATLLDRLVPGAGLAISLVGGWMTSRKFPLYTFTEEE